MSNENSNNEDSDKKPKLKKRSAPKTPIKKMSLADLMGDEEIQKFLSETEDDDKQLEKKTEPKEEIKIPPPKKESLQKQTKSGKKNLENKDVLGAISQLSKLSGSDEDSIEFEEISDESDEDLKRYIEQLEDAEKPSGTFSDLDSSDEVYSFEQPDISLPISPTELDESDLAKEKKELEKNLEKKIKTTEESEGEKPRKLSILGLKKRATPSKLKPKALRRIGIAFICFILLMPSFLLIPSYESNYSRQLLSSPYLGYMIWKEDINSRVDSKFIPAFAEKFVNPNVNLVMMRGETEYFKFMIRSLFSMPTKVQMSVSDFVHPDQTHLISNTNFVLLTEENVEGIYYPDQLKYQESEFELQSNTNYAIVLKYQSPNNATPGIYSGNLTLKLGTIESVVSISLKILNSELPQHNRIIFHSHNKLNAISDIETFRSLRISTAYIEYDYQYDINTNVFTFNWTKFDLLMNAAVSAGLEYFDISLRWIAPDGMNLFSSEYNASIIDAYTKIWQHITANNWQNFTLVDLGYQYSEAQIAKAANHISLIKIADPDIKILAGLPLTLESILRLKDIDIWALSQLDLQTKPEYVNNLLSNGKKILLAIEPKTELPYMNLKITNPLLHARLLPWLVFNFNLDGIYLYNSSDSRINAFGYGEDGLSTGLLLYRNDSEIVPSIRWTVFSQGIEDLGYLVRIKEIAQNYQETEAGQKALTIINESNKLIKSYIDYSISSSDYESLRLNMAEIFE